MSSRLQGSDKNAKILAKRYADHTFEDENGEEYSASNFGDFATYMRHKKAKLQNRNALLRSLPENQGKPQIFRGIVATANGYTNPSLQDLTEMVVAHGGIFVQYMDGKTSVTHIIATALTPKKMVEFARYKVVKPAWVVECIKEGKLLPWERWRVIQEGSRQAKLGFTSSQPGTPGSPGGVGLVTQRPRRSVASYKDVITPGRATPAPEHASTIGRGSVRPSPSVSSSKRPIPVTRSSSSSQVDIPDGKSFAIVIPKSRSATPKSESQHKGEEAAEDIGIEDEGEDGDEGEGEDEIEPEQPSTQECIWVGGKKSAPTVKDKSSTELFHSYQLPPPLPSSPFDGIPPSHQPEPPSDQVITPPDQELPESSPPLDIPPSHQPEQVTNREMPQSDYGEIPESSPPVNQEPDDEKFILSFTKSEGDAVESIMRALNDGKGTEAELPPSQRTVIDRGERSRRVTPRRFTVGKDEIPPTSPTEDIDLGNLRSEGFSGVVATIMDPTSPLEEPRKPATPIKESSTIKLENKRSPTPAKKRPLPGTTTLTNISSRSSPPLPKKIKLSSASTSEEANAALLANPRVRSTTVLNPDFLKQYYQESRLHHLSTWKAELKQKLQDLTQTSSNNKPPKSKRKHPRRYILHIDYDCFFAAISTRNHPYDLTGKPVVVTHGKGGEKNVSSEIASCNYKAREFGVKNGMWMGRALQLCPDIVCLPYDFPAYEEASREFYSVVLSLGADIVQSVSVDEVLVDVTSLCCTAGEGSIEVEQAHADALAVTVRNQVREKTKCEVSVGIGGNISLAKLALRKAKPAGQYQLKPEEVLDFLGGLGIRDLPSVGHSLAGRLSGELKISTVAQLRTTSRERLCTVVGGKTGEKLWNFAHGIDHAEVGDVPERKSVGADVSWGVRFETQAQAEEFLHNLAGELHRRLVEAKVKGKQVTVKILKRAKDAPVVTPKFLGSGECDVFTKSIALGMATWDQGILARESIGVLRGYRFPPVELRGLGLQMTKLEKVRIGEETAEGQKTLEFKPVPVVKNENENENEKPKQATPPPHAKPQPVAGPWAFMPPPPAPRPEPSNPPPPPPLSPAGSAPLASSQFIVPSASQIDPSVLEALPSTMRAGIVAAASKKASNTKPVSPPAPRRKLPFPAPVQPPPRPPRAGPSKHQNPPPPPIRDLIPPSASQIDPAFLASLTPGLREEILREYRSAQEPPPPPQGNLIPPRKNKGKGKGKGKERQTLLPQSPRKVREWGTWGGGGCASPSRSGSRPSTSGSPTAGRGRSPASGFDKGAGVRARGGYDITPLNLFPQHNHHNQPHNHKNPIAKIIYTPIPHNPTSAPAPPPLAPPKSELLDKLPSNLPPDLDPTVLASLPADILSEVLLHHKFSSNLLSPKPFQPPSLLSNPLHPPPSTRCLLLPCPPNKPHLQHLTTLPAIRDLLEMWVGEDKACEGPNEEDVDVLVDYLREVVVTERDLEKAMGVIVWFGVVVGEIDDCGGRKEIREGLKEWRRAVVRAAREGVGGGCKERGMPEVRFETPWGE